MLAEADSEPSLPKGGRGGGDHLNRRSPNPLLGSGGLPRETCYENSLKILHSEVINVHFTTEKLL